MASVCIGMELYTRGERMVYHKGHGWFWNQKEDTNGYGKEGSSSIVQTTFQPMLGRHMGQSWKI